MSTGLGLEGGGELDVDILQLRPLTVFPILGEFPMSIVQNSLLSSEQKAKFNK